MFQEEDLPVAIKKLTEFFQQQNETAVRVKILSLMGDIGIEYTTDVQVIFMYIFWLKYVKM